MSTNQRWYVAIICWYLSVVGCYSNALSSLRRDATSTEIICQEALQQSDTASRNTQGATSGTATPHNVLINTTRYLPSESIKVTVSTSSPYQGVLLQARQAGKTTVVGSFNSEQSLVDRHAEMTPYNCERESDTLMVYYRQGVSNQTYLWTPPSTDVGLVQFVGTVYFDETRVLPQVTSQLFRKGFPEIDLKECGQKKGCYRYGVTDCTTKTCDYLLTYKVTDDNVQFEMTGKEDWVAVGFSSDDKMGGDDVFICSRNRYSSDTSVAVRRYVTELSHQTPTAKQSNPLYDAETDSSTPNRLSCRFKRPLKVTQDPDPFSVDLNNNWYQLYAWGSQSTSGSHHRHTLDNPPTSRNKLTLRSSRNDFDVSGATRLSPSLFTVSAFFAFIQFSPVVLQFPCFPQRPTYKQI